MNDVTSINLCLKLIYVVANPVIYLVPVSLHFESCLSLTSLATATWSGTVVKPTPLYVLAQRRLDYSVPNINKNSSDGVNDGNDVD